VFTTQTGKPVAPDRMTRLFAKLVAASGLPPVTLHCPVSLKMRQVDGSLALLAASCRVGGFSMLLEPAGLLTRRMIRR
jgi:hypothetical protein